VKAIQRSEAGPAGAERTVMVVAPPPMQEVDWLADMFLGAAAKSLQLGAKLADVARRCRAAFVDAGAVVEASSVDGIHLDSDAHRALGTRWRRRSMPFSRWSRERGGAPARFARNNYFHWKKSF